MSVELVTTDGIFSLDGEDFDVTNNIWIVGDDREVVVVDAAHDAAAIVSAINGRRVRQILLTHGHNDHITVAPELSAALDAPVLLHPADEMLWRVVHPDNPFHTVGDDQVLTVGNIDIHAIHTPGHSPGSVCWHIPDLNAVISGDTLFHGGPGATGRSYSDFPTILASISERLGKLPSDTAVYTGHGDTTTIGGELVNYDDWVARGH